MAAFWYCDLLAGGRGCCRECLGGESAYGLESLSCFTIPACLNMPCFFLLFLMFEWHKVKKQGKGFVSQ